jgi:hypothetical protein
MSEDAMSQGFEITMRLELAAHGPGDLQGMAEALAKSWKEDAIEIATTAAEASGSEEVLGAVPQIRYRLLNGSSASDWHDV